MGTRSDAEAKKVNGKPMVSVVIIFLNAERFIEEAIESVFAQTYTDWELLLVDDGSTDGSTKIARYYVKQYPDKVRYLEHDGHKNKGMSATRNLGIRHSIGEYVAFLDSDDVWLPNKLEEQVTILQSRPQVAMVCGPSQYWYSWTGIPEDLRRDYVCDLGVQLDEVFEPPALLNLSLANAGTPCPSDFLIRRDMFERVASFEESFTGKYQSV